MKFKKLAPWKESYDKFRQQIKKKRLHFANKCRYSQSYEFSSIVYECKSWTVRKGEHRRTAASELWCWRRLPWMARRSNQSVVKEINLEYSLEGLLLKLKLQYLGYLMWRTSSLEKTLMLGKIEGGRRRGRQKWDGPHGLQHARLLCPSPSSRVCSNSCPWSWWCLPTISSSVSHFSSCL